jgi:hypothetical protein
MLGLWVPEDLINENRTLRSKNYAFEHHEILLYISAPMTEYMINGCIKGEGMSKSYPI